MYATITAASYGALKIVKLENSFHPEIFSVSNYSFHTVTSGADETGSNRVSAKIRTRENDNFILLRTGGEVSGEALQQNIFLNDTGMLNDQKCYCCFNSSAGVGQNFCGGLHCYYNQCQKFDAGGARCWNPICYPKLCYPKPNKNPPYCVKCDTN